MIPPEQLRYFAVRPDERPLMMHIIQLVPTDEEIMAQVDRLHAEGGRCATVISYLPSGHIEEGYTASAEVIRERFPLEPVKDALDEYDPTDSVCIVWRRGRNVTALVTGRP